MATGPGEYAKEIPTLAAHWKKIERALSRIYAAYASHPFMTVRQALVMRYTMKMPNESYGTSSTSSPGGSLRSQTTFRSDIST